jgi:hypothetical protein
MTKTLVATPDPEPERQASYARIAVLFRKMLSDQVNGEGAP